MARPDKPIRRAYRVGYTYEDAAGKLHAYSMTVLATGVDDAERVLREQHAREGTPRCTIIGAELVE